jgi:hypothetical protein
MYVMWMIFYSLGERSIHQDLGHTRLPIYLFTFLCFLTGIDRYLSIYSIGKSIIDYRKSFPLLSSPFLPTH